MHDGPRLLAIKRDAQSKLQISLGNILAWTPREIIVSCMPAMTEREAEYSASWALSL